MPCGVLADGGRRGDAQRAGLQRQRGSLRVLRPRAARRAARPRGSPQGGTQPTLRGAAARPGPAVCRFETARSRSRRRRPCSTTVRSTAACRRSAVGTLVRRVRHRGLLAAAAVPGAGRRDVGARVAALGGRRGVVDGGLTYSRSGVSYADVLVRVRALTPAGGPRRGGTRVALRADGLRDLGGLRCLFDGEVPSEIRDVSREPSCTAPPDSPAGWGAASRSVAVGVTLNGELNGASVDGAPAFTYYDPDLLRIAVMHPRGGPATGGTVLHVSLADDALLVDLGGEAHGLLCRFDGTALRRVVVDAAGTPASELASVPVWSTASSPGGVWRSEHVEPWSVVVSASIADCAGRRECGGGGRALRCVAPERWRCLPRRHGDLAPGQHRRPELLGGGQLHRVRCVPGGRAPSRRAAAVEGARASRSRSRRWWPTSATCAAGLASTRGVRLADATVSGAGEVRCATPPARAVGRVVPAVTLNGQQYAGTAPHAAAFEYCRGEPHACAVPVDVRRDGATPRRGPRPSVGRPVPRRHPRHGRLHGLPRRPRRAHLPLRSEPDVAGDETVGDGGGVRVAAALRSRRRLGAGSRTRGDAQRRARGRGGDRRRCTLHVLRAGRVCDLVGLPARRRPRRRAPRRSTASALATSSTAPAPFASWQRRPRSGAAGDAPGGGGEAVECTSQRANLSLADAPASRRAPRGQTSRTPDTLREARAPTSGGAPAAPLSFRSAPRQRRRRGALQRRRVHVFPGRRRGRARVRGGE